jgi:hypothetical protein
MTICIGCCILKVGVEESIVNAPLVRLQSQNTNYAKSEVRFKQRIRHLLICNLWCVHNRLFKVNLEDELNEHPIIEGTN